MIKRFLPLMLVAVLGAVLAGSAAQAAGGGTGALPPGVSHLTDMSALADFFNGDGSSSFIFVDQGNSFFLSGHGSGAPTLQPEVTVLSIVLQPNISTPPIRGCFIIPNTDFRIDANLGTAVLNTTLPTSSNCGDNLIITASGREITNQPSASSTSGLAINMTWTGNGVVAQAGVNLNYSCQSYLINGRQTTGMGRATASGTISALPGTLSTQFTLLRSSSIDVNVVGDFNALCPFVAGLGGGGG